MRGLFVQDVLTVTRGCCYGPREYLAKEIYQADTDSRNLSENGLFFAIKGNRLDAHALIPELFAEGKIACALGESEYKEVFSELPERELNGIYIKVNSIYDSLADVASMYRNLLNAKIIGITGSVGKTGTKELISAVLSEKYKVHKTQGNYNNEIGVPLTIFGIEPDTEAAVIEMGISGFGQMSLLAAIVRPDIMVMTNIGNCHLEQLGDRSGVLRAKSEALDFLMPGGAIVLNADDDMLSELTEHISVYKNSIQRIKPVFYGIKEQNTALYASDIELSNDGHPKFCIKSNSFDEFDVELALIGEHHIYNALAATAVAMLMGMDTEATAKGLCKASSIPGRAKLHRLNNGSRLIDDCYNANPESMRAALISCSNMPAKSKLAILGDMKEQGKNAAAAHSALGAFAAEDTDIDRLWFVGEDMRTAYDSAGAAQSKELRYFEAVDDVISELNEAPAPDTLILIKASHSMGFDRIRDKLLN